MAKVSYVPYSDDYAELFAFCGITLPTSDFGGNLGWDAAQFAAQAINAKKFLDDHYDEYDENTMEEWFNMLDNYSVFYWSTEKPIIG